MLMVTKPASAACAAAHASFSGGILADGIDLRDMNRKRKARLTPTKAMIQQTSDRIVQYQNEMKILILYGAIGSMATVDSALFSSSAICVIKMIVLSLLHISLNQALAKLRVWLKHSAHRPIPISKSP